MALLGTILVWLAGICLVIHLLTFTIVAARKYWHPKSSIADWRNEKVTILRPVSGIENNLERTLSSAFELEHPNFEIIFCVAKNTDPVIPLVETLIKRYPSVSSSLLIGDDPISDNPKLNNLVKGWKAAKYDWIVMTDSNVLLPKDYLAQLFSRWDKKAGLVVSPPLGTEPENMPADLEAAFLNSYQARWQLASDTIDNGFAQGKTLFWRRDILENGGGIEALARELAEDAAATKVVREQGLKVRLSTLPFPQPLGKKTWGPVWKRQMRWAKLRRDSFPLFFYLEILSGPIFPFVCLIIAALIGTVSFWLILAFFVIWYVAEFCVTALVGWPMSLRQIIAILLRDTLLPILWFSAFGKSGYQWQGYKVEISKK